MTKFDFIHIGMGRSMSTYLQEIFLASDNYQTFKTSTFSNYASNLILQTSGDVELIAKKLKNLSIDDTPFSSVDISKVNVLTDEGLTFSFPGTPDVGRYCLLHQNICANLLAPYTKNVILIVRNPLDWIKSLYAYNIKINSYEKTIADFVDEYNAVILGNLNLKELFMFWEQLDIDVHVIPMEANKNDNSDFWNAFGQLFELPCGDKDNLSKVQKNQSTYDTLKIHKNLNYIQNHFARVLSQHDYPERDFLKRSQEEQKWNTRRFFEFANVETLENISSLFAQTDFSFNVTLNAELTEYLETNYIGPLQTKFAKRFMNIYHDYLTSIGSQKVID